MARSWTLHDYIDWQAYCREVAPPLNLTMAAYVGFKPKPKAKAVEAMTETEFAAELRELEGFFSGF